MKNKFYYLALCTALVLSACDSEETETAIKEDPSSFAEIGSIDLGDAGASEITAYDADTKKLFVVNNSGTSRIDVVDLTSPATPALLTSIDITSYGAGVNSVAVYKGKLAASIEATVKTDNGKIVVFNTNTLAKLAEVTVGALPDMVTFSPDGNLIVSANEGEPNADYSVDPIGSVSIISVNSNYAVSTLDFAGFESSATTLKAAGLRIFGPNASFAQDIEPEYVAISKDSKTAWITLQENNGMAKVNLATKAITNIYPLGFKDHNTDANAMDPSDKDNVKALSKFKVKGMYQPDAIAAFSVSGTEYVITANEGDAREYTGFAEETTVNKLVLDATNYPDGANLKTDAQLGRLRVTKTLGDANADGTYEELYSYGARSFSIWNGSTGAMVFDSGKGLEEKLLNENAALYDDTRSDNKGVEPEGVAVATMSGRIIAFVGLERADAVMVYDVTNPSAPVFLKVLVTGDAPEGVLYIPASDGPTGKSLLVVSSEADGLLKIYEPNTL